MKSQQKDFFLQLLIVRKKRDSANETELLTNQLKSQDTVWHGPFDIILVCGSEVIACQQIDL